MGRVAHWFVGIVVLAASALGATRAQAQSCDLTQRGTVTATISSQANLGTFDPFASPLPKNVTVTITRTGGSAPTCDLAFGFRTSANTPRMQGVSSILRYDITRVGFATTLSYTTPTPANGDRVNLNAVGNTSVPTDVQFLVTASQPLRPAGPYTEAISLEVFQRTGTVLSGPIAVLPVFVDATVAKVCQLDTPSVSTINFAPSEIPNGLPNPAIVKTTSMLGSCTAPAFIKLTGESLKQSTTPPGPASFDKTINYRAVATFRNATAILITSDAPQTIQSATPGGPATGVSNDRPVEVGINLIPNQRLVAGSYTGTLTVSLEPQP